MSFHQITLHALGILLVLYGSVPNLATAQPSTTVKLPSAIQDELRVRIETGGRPLQIEAEDAPILATSALFDFYQRRVFQPTWSNDRGPTPQVDELLAALRGADAEGLRPGDYHLASISSLLERVRASQQQGRTPDPRRLAELDLLCTDAFLLYGAHLLSGRINPETIDAEWIANRRGADMADVLEQALATSTIERTLNGLRPPQPGYARLKRALVRYQALAETGGWDPIPEGPALKLGSEGTRVAALRQRLIATGDVAAPSVTDTSLAVFDAALEAGVRRFQERHGLDVDGVVGPVTLMALNVPVERRIQQIVVNLERWRWLPQDLGERYILVNIAAFHLEVVEAGRSALSMRVVVGRPYRRTPVFSGLMTYLVFSPYWHVPPSLAVQDKLPLIKKDVNYLAQQNMKVFQGWGGDAKEIDPHSVDWSTVTARHFPYRLRQDPGPQNALGRVKFMFPNRFNVYLHDTPSRELFRLSERSFSSGCIRVEKPIELAQYLLADNSQWAADAIQRAISRNVEQTVTLKRSIPVHLLYWTAWADEDGTVHFRNDIYGRDAKLQRALAEKPPVAP